MQKVTIIGSGSWATALVKIFSESNLSVGWLVRDAEGASFRRMNGYNPRYLGFARFKNHLVEPTTDINQALQDSSLAVFITPSAYLMNTAKVIDRDVLKEIQIAVSIKGFIPGTGWIPNVYLQKQFEPQRPVAVLAGPCHAEEVASGKPTWLTVSCLSSPIAEKISRAINVPYIKTIINNDPAGVEYSAILKNIIGIASGIALGLNYGQNFQAVLVSNAMKETKRFLHEVDPAERELCNSTYFGDLLVTAYSNYSRNHTLGKLVGRGINVNTATQAMEMIAEGFHASRELEFLLKKININLPVFNAVYRVLHQHASPAREFALLEKHLC
jgi:glycerol-3-phosphate dehydrogenase (NAD(P)+)